MVIVFGILTISEIESGDCSDHADDQIPLNGFTVILRDCGKCNLTTLITEE
jgi:hypothetical protein